MTTTRLVIAGAAALLALAACHKAPKAQAGDTASAIDNSANSLDTVAANMSNEAASANLNEMANNMRSDAGDVAAAFNMENAQQ